MYTHTHALNSHTQNSSPTQQLRGVQVSPGFISYYLIFKKNHKNTKALLFYKIQHAAHVIT